MGGVSDVISFIPPIVLTRTIRYQCHEFTDLLKFEWAAYMALSTIAFVDVVIAASLCYLLANSRTGFSG